MLSLGKLITWRPRVDMGGRGHSRPQGWIYSGCSRKPTRTVCVGGGGPSTPLLLHFCTYSSIQASYSTHMSIHLFFFSSFCRFDLSSASVCPSIQLSYIFTCRIFLLHPGILQLRKVQLCIILQLDKSRPLRHRL